MDKFAAKQALRLQIKAALKELSTVERSVQSEKVTRKLLQHPKYLKSNGVSVFLSLKDEIETADIIQNIFSSGKCCYIPK